MRNLARDTRTVWVSLYESKEKLMEEGEWTGEYLVTRSTPYATYPTLSAARGASDEEVFGVSVNYDRVAKYDSTETGITETAVFWVESAPEFDANGNLRVDEYGNPTVPWDYTVALVAVSPNVTSVALNRVDLA